MREDIEYGSHAWMLTHAVALDTNKPSITYTKQNTTIVTDVFIMILCKAFAGQKTNSTQPGSD